MNSTCKKILKMSMVFITLNLLYGCIQQVRYPAPPDATVDRTTSREITASACGFQLVQLLPLGTADRQERAYRELVEKAKGDYVGDIEMTEDWYYGVIGSVYCTAYKAKAYGRTGPQS